MKFILSKTNIIFTLIALVLGFSNFIYLLSVNDLRVADQALSFSEMKFWEVANFMYFFPSTVIIVFSSFRYACKHEKYLRAFITTGMWPSSFYFLLKYRQDYGLNH